MLDGPQPIEEIKKVVVSERMLIVGTNLNEEQEKRLTELLGRNLDLFAWAVKDVLRI